MAESVDCSEFCRICLVKDQANVPIFEEQGDMQQTYLKISTCLPIKVSYEDSLPKRICDGCNYKLEQQYQFWNTSLNAEKQLKQWLGIPDVPEVVEAPLKIKREKDSKANVTTKRPRRNARRKAAVNVRQVVAAVAASDSGPGEDMDMDNSFGKDDDMDHNDYNENSDALTDSPFINSNIDSEQVQAGPSGLQKNTDVENADVEETPGAIAWIKEDPDLDESIPSNETVKKSNSNASHKKIKFDEDEEYEQVLDKFRCLNCLKMFNRKDKCKDHYRVHLDVRPFECNYCDKKFKQGATLRTHKKLHDDIRRTYQCKICRKEFKSANYSKRCEKIHAGITEHKCTECNKEFYDKSSLTIHLQKTHNAIEHQCHVCSKVYPNKYSFDYHFRSVHNAKPSEATLKCELCGRVYNNVKLYRKHVRSHEGFACEVCGKMFGYGQALRNHILIHTGEKPWQCTVCSKSFRKKHMLTIHLRTHTNEKPYECKECGKRFTQRTPLVIHTRTHTGERPYLCCLCSEAFISKNYLRIHMQNVHDCP